MQQEWVVLENNVFGLSDTIMTIAIFVSPKPIESSLKNLDYGLRQ